MSIRMHTKSNDNFLCSDTAEGRSAECPDTNYVIRNFIHLHIRMMKNLKYINTLADEKPNNAPFHGKRGHCLDHPEPHGVRVRQLRCI